jgi:hypothetical protein
MGYEEQGQERLSLSGIDSKPHDGNQAEQIRTIFSEKERKGIMKK